MYIMVKAFFYAAYCPNCCLRFTPHSTTDINLMADEFQIDCTTPVTLARYADCKCCVFLLYYHLEMPDVDPLCKQPVFQEGADVGHKTKQSLFCCIPQSFMEDSKRIFASVSHIKKP